MKESLPPYNDPFPEFQVFHDEDPSSDSENAYLPDEKAEVALLASLLTHTLEESVRQLLEDKMEFTLKHTVPRQSL